MNTIYIIPVYASIILKVVSFFPIFLFSQDAKASSRHEHKHNDHNNNNSENKTSSDPSENNKFRLLGDLPSLAGDRYVECLFFALGLRFVYSETFLFTRCKLFSHLPIPRLSLTVRINKSYHCFYRGKNATAAVALSLALHSNEQNPHAAHAKFMQNNAGKKTHLWFGGACFLYSMLLFVWLAVVVRIFQMRVFFLSKCQCLRVVGCFCYSNPCSLLLLFNL